MPVWPVPAIGSRTVQGVRGQFSSTSSGQVSLLTRPVAPPASGKVTSRPVLRGLHHNYFWQAANSVGRGTHQPSSYLH